MNANGDVDGILAAMSVLLVPTFDRFQNVQSAHCRVCGISRSRDPAPI